MKSTLIVIAVALASGLLVASGALAGEAGWGTGPQAQQAGFRHEVDIMAPGLYTTWDLGSAISAGQAETGEMAPAGSRREIDVMGSEYTTWDQDSAISAGQAETGEMVPAGSRHEIDVMGSEYTTWDLGSAISAGQGGGEEMTPAIPSPQQGSEELSPAGSAPQQGSEEMAPAGSSSHEEYVTPHNAPYRAPAENQSY
jgi:hypothetical protein